jgi:transcriptional regulator GlxA family with amidase domain
VYAAAGLLAGRPATTSWGAVEELRALDATVAIREHDRFVDDGDLITSAGVSAGIDMALHLVDRLAGGNRAARSGEASSTSRSPRSDPMNGGGTYCSSPYVEARGVFGRLVSSECSE